MCGKIWRPGHSDRDGDPPVIPALAAPDAQVLDPQVDIFGIERARYLGEMKSTRSPPSQFYTVFTLVTNYYEWKSQASPKVEARQRGKRKADGTAPIKSRP